MYQHIIKEQLLYSLMPAFLSTDGKAKFLLSTHEENTPTATNAAPHSIPYIIG